LSWGKVGKYIYIQSKHSKMPKSFLVKKKVDNHFKLSNHHYQRLKAAYDDSLESIKAVVPFTPSLQPLTVRLNNGKSSIYTVLKQDVK